MRYCYHCSVLGPVSDQVMPSHSITDGTTATTSASASAAAATAAAAAAAVVSAVIDRA